MRRRYSRNKYAQNIPAPTGPDWLQVNDVRLWLPEDKRQAFDRANVPAEMSIQNWGRGWGIALSAVKFLLRCIPQEATKYEIGRASKTGEGLSKEVYHVDVAFFEDKEEIFEPLAVGLLLDDADPEAAESAVKEQRLLETLDREDVSFLVPEPWGVLWHKGRLISILEFAGGMSLELRAERSQVKRPWEIIGKIAAEIHSLPIADLPDSVKRYTTRREHVVAAIEVFRKYNVQEIQYAIQWISDNMPPDEASVLVHGDLLGQNILWNFEGECYVIDWEYAFIGDPARDLAIVTRGARKPFQVGNGLDRLIEAYLSASGKNISKKDVRVHELILCLGWYEQSLDRSQGGHGPEYYLDFLRRLLRRVGG